MEWRSISTTSWSNYQPKTGKNSGNAYGYEYAYRLKLSDFAGSLSFTSKKLGESEYSILEIPNVQYSTLEGESDSKEGTKFDVTTWPFFFDAGLQTVGDDGNPSEKAAKLMNRLKSVSVKPTNGKVSFHVTNDLAPRLKLALEDLFKAHGAKVSKY